MPYCTQDDLKGLLSEAELIQLTDDSIPPQVVDQTKLDRAVTAAGELIDGYLRGRYVLPLAPPQGIIRELAVTVTAYNLFRRRRKGQFPQAVADDYKNALKLLEHIQAGKIDLSAAKVTASNEAGTSTTTAGSGVAVSAPARLFSDEKLEGYL